MEQVLCRRCLYGKKRTNGSAAAREPMAMQPDIACQNGREIWLHKQSLHRRISDFFERVQLLARPGTQYSFHISGNRGYDSNRVCSLSIFVLRRRRLYGNKSNHTVLWRGTTQHQDSRGSKTQGSQDNTPSTGWAIGLSVAWVSSCKLIPGVHIVWIDQVKDGLEVIASTNHLEILCFVTEPPLAVVQFIVTHTERDHVARSCRRTLIVLSEEDRRMLSLWWWRGTWALGRCELACHRLLESSASLFFPHRSLGGIKREGARGAESLYEKKLSASAERQDWNSRNESSQSCWTQHQRGISPSMTHTQRECHPRAGETCTSYNDSTAFETTPLNLFF